MHDKILILDFGSQVTQLIARRVREAHVYCEIHPNDVSDDFIRSFAPKGIILSGSHASTYEDHQLRAAGVFDLGVPVLGICYGMQTMAVQLGGKVELERHPRVRLRRGARPWPHPPAEGMCRTSPRPKATACSRSG
jgi:GMP synthase (glutamine-hydrolysing)